MAVTPQGKECSESALAILNMISLRTILLILPLTIWADLERFIWKLAEEKCRTENVHVTRFLHEAVFQLCTLFEMSYYLFHWPFRWTLERTKSYKPNLFNSKSKCPGKRSLLNFTKLNPFLMYKEGRWLGKICDSIIALVDWHVMEFWSNFDKVNLLCCI